MTRGKGLFRTTEWSAGMPHETVADPDLGNSICKFDAGTSWLTESHSAEHRSVHGADSQADCGDAAFEMEVHGNRKSRRALTGIPVNSKVSNLKRTKIKLQGKISELFCPKSLKIKVEQETQEHPAVELEPQREPLPETDQIVPPEPKIPGIEDVEVRSADINVQIVPTPVKRPRSPKIELTAKPSKPLKVIRRRREEPPKVFETASKDFPRSMLEGIKVGQEEERDFPPD